MSIDPMTSYEQAEAEAVERADEARKEQHYAEAEQAAREFIAKGWVDQDEAVCEIFDCLSAGNYVAHVNVLADFREHYGTPALLRVIARALESGGK